MYVLLPDFFSAATTAQAFPIRIAQYPDCWIHSLVIPTSQNLKLSSPSVWCLPQVTRTIPGDRAFAVGLSCSG